MNLATEIEEKFTPDQFANTCYDLGGGLNEGFFGGLRAKNIDDSIPELKEALQDFEVIFKQYEEMFFEYQKALENLTELFLDHGIEIDD